MGDFKDNRKYEVERLIVLKRILFENGAKEKPNS